LFLIECTAEAWKTFVAGAFCSSVSKGPDPMRLSIVAAAAVAGALVMGACGSDNNNKSASPTVAGATTTAGGAETTAAPTTVAETTTTAAPVTTTPDPVKVAFGQAMLDLGLAKAGTDPQEAAFGQWYDGSVRETFWITALNLAADPAGICHGGAMPQRLPGTTPEQKNGFVDATKKALCPGT
jgi:hypothetical protein